ncbi:MAG TPA: HNH endonuclease, partial [Magnetospirillaceae bacterium]
MGVNLVVAVTDGDWYSYLSNRPDLPEVNFWAPGGNVAFRALQQGELFLFKLHAPRNFIVGYGVFAYANTLPCSLAWAGFGEKNGAASFQEMRQRIVRYRKLKGDTREDFVIGCRLLSQPVFFDEDHWIKVPDSWSRNIVSFKKYNTDESDGRHLWEAIQNLSVDTSVEATDLGEEQDRYGTPTLIRPRLGQGA